jgi:hypothetical protein
MGCGIRQTSRTCVLHVISCEGNEVSPLITWVCLSTPHSRSLWPTQSVSIPPHCLHFVWLTLCAYQINNEPSYLAGAVPPLTCFYEVASSNLGRGFTWPFSVPSDMCRSVTLHKDTIISFHILCNPLLTSHRVSTLYSSGIQPGVFVPPGVSEDILGVRKINIYIISR